LLEVIKPLFQAIHLLLTLCVGVFAVRRPHTPALWLLSTACFVTVIVDAVYLSVSLQTEWKIILFPVEVRRVLFLLAELLFVIEVFLWPLALFFIVRERRASIPPSI
jgi:hydrogenase/urease accessory protein HupE